MIKQLDIFYSEMLQIICIHCYQIVCSRCASHPTMLPGVDSYIASLIAVTTIIANYFQHVDVLVNGASVTNTQQFDHLLSSFYITNTGQFDHFVSCFHIVRFLSYSTIHPKKDNFIIHFCLHESASLERRRNLDTIFLSFMCTIFLPTEIIQLFIFRMYSVF